jgi:micrococcal nuclease
MLKFILPLCVLTLSACADQPEPGIATVRKVIDGDTIELRIGTSNETVRLLGIDTPETIHPSKPVECFGPEASARTKQLLPQGTKVRIERDTEARDHFGRLLLYVYLGDRMVNEVLLSEGFAVPLPIEPNTTHATQFDRVSGEARTASAGLWGACRQ